MFRTPLALLAALAVGFSASLAPAVTHTWQGPGSSMNSAANWLGAVVPTSGDTNLTLVIPAGANSSPIQDIAGTLSLESLQIGASSGYSYSGNAYQFNNLGAAPTIAIGANAGASFSAPLDFNAPTALTIDNNAFLQFFAPLSGNDLTINSTATSTQPFIYFSNSVANTLGGTTTLSGYFNASLNSPANVTALSGDLVVSGLSNFQFGRLVANAANQIAAGTDVAAINFGRVELYAPHTFNNLEVSTGGLQYISSTLTVQGDLISNGGSATINGGTLDFNGQFKTVNTTLGGPGDVLSISSAITNGRINKSGPGRLDISSAANSFSGQNVVNAGVLVGAASSIGADVLNNATVQVNGGTLATNIISGPGSVIVSGVTFAAPQSYTGGTEVLSYSVGNASTLLGDFTSSSFAQLGFNQVSNGAYAGNLTGNLGLLKQGAGVLSLNGNSTTSGAIQVFDGGLNILSDTAIGTGPLQMYAGNGTLEATGTRTLGNVFDISGTTTFVGGGDFNFTDTTPKSLSQVVAHNSTGTTTIDGKFSLFGGSLTVNAGNLVLGDPAAVGGFIATGPIAVNGGTLSLRSLNFISLPNVTLAGGTLDTVNGYAIPLGAALQGNGGVSGRVASANGSSVIANGALALGDAAHPAGVNLDGELYTAQNTVTLLDSNQAVLGALTDLGTPTQNGALASTNGYVLNFGRNIVGRGQIQSTNTLAQAAIINGAVNGDSPANYLEFTGYVKGVGTFNNTAFSGTLAPGLSPTLSTVGNVILLPNNLLDMEIGGLSRGGQYDAFDITGVMQLGGTMQVSLINAYAPSLGDQFLLFQGVSGGSFGGTFSGFNFPALNPGLAWDTSLLYGSGILQVVNIPEPTALALLGLGLAGWGTRRSRR